MKGGTGMTTEASSSRRNDVSRGAFDALSYMSYLRSQGGGDVFAAISRTSEIGRMVRTFVTAAFVGVAVSAVFLFFTAI